MKPIVERFIKPAAERKRTTDSEIHRNRTVDEPGLVPSLAEIDSRLRRAEAKLALESPNSYRPSLDDLNRRLSRLEQRLGFASAGVGAWQGSDDLPSLGQLDTRLKNVEQNLGFMSVAAVGSRGGDSQRSIDAGKQAAREAHDVATKVSAINIKNEAFWAAERARQFPKGA